MFHLKDPTGSDSFAHPQAVPVPKVITPEFAVVARTPTRHDDKPSSGQDFYGRELRMVVVPSTLDKTFQRAAKPLPINTRCAGRLTLENTPGPDVIGWTVRAFNEQIYVAAVRRVRSGTEKLFAYTEPEYQPIGIEQITFRFSSDDWATHGPELAQGLESWISETRRNPDDHFWFERAKAPSICVLADPVEEGETDPETSDATVPLLGHVQLESAAETRVLSSRMLSPGGENFGTLTALVQNLSPKQRRTAVLALGFRVRFSKIDFQVFDSEGMRLSETGECEEEWLAFNTLEAMGNTSKSSNVHWVDTLDSLMTSSFAKGLTKAMQAQKVLRTMTPDTPRSLVKADIPTLKSALVLLNRMTSLRLGQGQDVSEVQQVHRTFLCSLLASFRNLGAQLWMEIAKQEFSPAIFASLLTGSARDARDAALSALMKLRHEDPAAYTALTNRMDQNGSLQPMLWDDLLDTIAPSIQPSQDAANKASGLCSSVGDEKEICAQTLGPRTPRLQTHPYQALSAGVSRARS